MHITATCPNCNKSVPLTFVEGGNYACGDATCGCGTHIKLELKWITPRRKPVEAEPDRHYEAQYAYAAGYHD